MYQELESLGIKQVAAVESMQQMDYMRMGADSKTIEGLVKTKLAGMLARSIINTVPIEKVEDYYNNTINFRLKFWIAQPEQMEKLMLDRIRIAQPIDIDCIPMPTVQYKEQNISTVPAGQIPDKPTAEMLSAYDDAYNKAMYDSSDQVSPEERGLQAVLNLLRK